MLGEEKLINILRKQTIKRKLLKLMNGYIIFWAMDIVMQLRLLGKLQLY